jgi:chromosomal replication initiation ATPase DnaA
VVKKAKTIDDVKTAVAAHFKISAEDLSDLAKSKGHSTARKIAIFLANKLDTSFSNAQLAEAFGYNSKRFSTSIGVAFNSIQYAMAKPVGKKTEHEINLIADVYEIAQKAGISLE